MTEDAERDIAETVPASVSRLGLLPRGPYPLQGEEESMEECSSVHPFPLWLRQTSLPS